MILMDPIMMDRKFAASAGSTRDPDLLGERQEALKGLLFLLPSPWRRVVVLFHLRETPLRIIDERLGFAPGYAEDLLHRAENALRRIARLVVPELCENSNGRGR